MDYIITDPSEHADIHRGYIDIDDQQVTVTITSEGIVIDLYDDNSGEHVGTVASTFDEIAEIITRLFEGAAHTCTSDDPNNHQSDTCPIHEEDN